MCLCFIGLFILRFSFFKLVPKRVVKYTRQLMCIRFDIGQFRSLIPIYYQMGCPQSFRKVKAKLSFELFIQYIAPILASVVRDISELVPVNL